jgi:ubiquinone/menaquinone biosynthesis C-methylase UbiE
LDDGDIWNQYWRFDRIASCFDGAGAGNYDECVAAGWRGWFQALPKGARILDLCTGNGAAALIAAAAGRAGGKDFEIVAVDRAEIDPPAFVTRHAEDYAAIRFVPGTDIEALPLPDAGFDAVISQYGIEYAHAGRAIPEAMRMIAPGGSARFVVHAGEGVIAEGSRAIVAEADALLGEIGLPRAAARCFAELWAVEREGRQDRAEADRAFAAFQEALVLTARRVPEARDQAMFKNSGAVLFDTFQRRGHFDLDQLLAKAAEIEGEIRAHRGRLVALVEAALDEAGAEALAARIEGTSKPLRNQGELIGYVIEA